jgi:hypothetical protein
MKLENALHSTTVDSKLSQCPAGGDNEQLFGEPTALLQLGSAASAGLSSVPGSISSHTDGSPPEVFAGSASALLLERAGSTPPVSGLLARPGWLQAAAAKDAVKNKKRERSTCMARGRSLSGST